jgi:2-keto-4-pentenoate hydratase/2-oxohepta-3-ene-1,7-dioic acid hydratase in catechol pathway
MDHATEMGGTAPPSPVFFLKPPQAVVGEGAQVPWPLGSSLLHHEVELAAIIGVTAREVDEEDALSVVAGLAVAVDLTARDLQAAARKEGLPWLASKGFNGSCPLSRPRCIEDCPPWNEVRLELWVNGNLTQSGCCGEMVHGLPKLIASASRLFTLRPGDILLTGTPSGIGPLEPGAVVRARASDVGEITFTVGPKR